MPRVKKNIAINSEKIIKRKPKAIAKDVRTASVIKKKARPVVIDVIEDEEPKDFFPELPKIEENFPLNADNLSQDNPITDNEIDRQKIFFSDLASQIKEKKQAPFLNSGQEVNDQINNKTELVVRKSVNLYRKLVWRFLVLTVFLLLIVFYFSFSRLTISISPKGEVINDNLLLKVGNNNLINASSSALSGNAIIDYRDEISGQVEEIALTEEKTFSASGEEFAGEEISGKVKIINNSNKSQALVATTRILSPDNKLFRIKEAVNVPAGGEVEVDIYTEKPSEDLAIGPTTFTIPGLWLGLQDKIFAKNSASFVFSQKVKKYIKASDIDSGMKEMNNLLLAKAKENGKAITGSEEALYEILKPLSFETNAQAGEAKENFTIKATGSFLKVSFSKDQVAKLAAKKLALVVPDDKNLVDYQPTNITYTFDNYDAKTGVVIVKASFSGTMILKKDTEIIDKKQLVNLNRQQLENYLKSFPEIKDYEFKFYPSFITRAPRLPERIQIDIKGLDK